MRQAFSPCCSRKDSMMSSILVIYSVAEDNMERREPFLGPALACLLAFKSKISSMQLCIVARARGQGGPLPSLAIRATG